MAVPGQVRPVAHLVPHMECDLRPACSVMQVPCCYGQHREGSHLRVNDIVTDRGELILRF